MSCTAGTALPCLAPSVHPANAVHQAARRILSERQFAPKHQAFVASVESWVARQFNHFLGLFFDGGALTAGGLVAAAVIAAMALGLATRYAVRTRHDPSSDRPDVRPVRRRPVEWDAEAAQHEAAGEWRQALRCRYRSLVAELARRGVVDEIPGRTAREYEAQVAGRLEGGARPFSEVSHMFESVWYGNDPSGPDDVRRLRSLSDEVLESVR